MGILFSECVAVSWFQIIRENREKRLFEHYKIIMERSQIVCDIFQARHFALFSIFKHNFPSDDCNDFKLNKPIVSVE